jgi:hypothetical protein
LKLARELAPDVPQVVTDLLHGWTPPGKPAPLRKRGRPKGPQNKPKTTEERDDGAATTGRCGQVRSDRPKRGVAKPGRTRGPPAGWPGLRAGILRGSATRWLGDLDTPPSDAQLTEIIDSVCGLGANGGQFGGQSRSVETAASAAMRKVPAARARYRAAKRRTG